MAVLGSLRGVLGCGDGLDLYGDDGDVGPGFEVTSWHSIEYLNNFYFSILS